MFKYICILLTINAGTNTLAATCTFNKEQWGNSMVGYASIDMYFLCFFHGWHCRLVSCPAPHCFLPTSWLICVIVVLWISKHHPLPIQVPMFLRKFYSLLFMHISKEWLFCYFFVCQWLSALFCYSLHCASWYLYFTTTIFKHSSAYILARVLFTNQYFFHPLALPPG